MGQGTYTDSEAIEGMVQRMAMLRNWSPQTLVAYCHDVLAAHEWLQEQQSCSVFDAKRKDIVAYLAALGQQQLKHASIARKRSALSVFYRYLCLEKRREDNPTEHLPRVMKEHRLPQSMSEEDVARLLDAPDVATAIGLRDRCMLELMYASGLRVSELVSLRLAQVDMVACLLRVLGKGGKERMVPFGETSEVYLQQWLQQRASDAPFLFSGRGGRAMTRQNFWLRVKKYAREVGMMPEPSPHTLRHAFATHLLSHGANLRSIQLMLGHAHITTTEIYTHINNQRLHACIEEHHPLGKQYD